MTNEPVRLTVELSDEDIRNLPMVPVEVVPAKSGHHILLTEKDGVVVTEYVSDEESA